jgi:hypothetical protein
MMHAWMSSSRFAILARVLAVASCLDTACAADAGDPPKSAPGDAGPADDTGPPSGDEENDSSGPSAAPETGSEAGDDDADDASPVAAIADAAAIDAVVESSVDAACDLPNIPSSCPNCMTQNASDMPTCELYLRCFVENSCNPSAACGSNDGVCGVNKIGGGEAPYQAAVQTYNCACP